jgi:hypothetical protein
MSAANATKIFGIRVSIDPKILIGGLVALAAVLFWYNSHSDEGDTASTPTRAPVAETAQTAPAVTAARKQAARRGSSSANDRGRLRLRNDIDATRGDIDPTLRLDLLSRLSTVKYEPARRSVFEIGAMPTPEAAALAAAAKGRPILPPTPVAPPQPVIPSGPPPVNIPLKYYGFVKPMGPGQANRGLFLDGDNILVASEGQTLKQRYLVVELAPNSAKMEDTIVKRGQTLPVVPAALQQQ